MIKRKIQKLNPVWLSAFLSLTACCYAQVATYVQFTTTNFVVNRSAGRVIVTVQRPLNLKTNSTDVSYQTYDGTALVGVDYLSTSGILQWNAFELCAKSFSVPIIKSEVGTTNISFLVKLSTGPAIGSLHNTNTMGDYFVLYNGQYLHLNPSQRIYNLRRDWLPDVMPNSSVVFQTNSGFVPAGLGSISNAFVTISTDSYQPVITIPSLSTASIQTNGVLITFLMETGTGYVVFSSTNLNNWIKLTNFVCNCATNSIQDLSATNKSSVFYRAVAQ